MPYRSALLGLSDGSEHGWFHPPKAHHLQLWQPNQQKAEANHGKMRVPLKMVDHDPKIIQKLQSLGKSMGFGPCAPS
jgi:hypothetical protein